MEIIGIERSEETAGTRTILRYEARRMEEDRLESGGEEEAIVFDSLSFEELLDLIDAGEGLRAVFSDPKRLTIQPGGWQSWSAGWELAHRETLPRRVLVVPELIKFTNRDGDDHGKREIVGHFIMYLRSGDDYLCIASREGGELPPVTWRIDRSAGRVTMEAYFGGASLNDAEPLAELHLFHAHGFFALKDELRRIYSSEERFSGLDFLFGGAQESRAGATVPPYGKDSIPGGFESWYNHYTDIDEKLVLDDLEALDRTENLINLRYIRRKRPTVFQIDDGWEVTVGEWEIDGKRFPNGLRSIADKIEAKGYIPGLWLAPFLVTKKARIYREKSEWLLRDAAGQPVVAGFNDKWDNQFHCLDISREDVLAYLKGLIDRAIDEWGFRYLKLDFMYAGLLSGAFTGEAASSGRSAARGRSSSAPYKNYERACRILTARTKDAAGRKVAYLGCGVPFGPSYRHFPLSRIGADTRETWDWPKVKLIRHVGRPSAYISLMDTIGRSYMDGTVFVNDPDVVFLRTRNCSLTENEKELVALVDFLLASQVMFSDDPVHVDAAEAAFTSRIAKLYDELSGQAQPSEEYGATRIARNVFRLESRSGKIAGLLNLRDTAFVLRQETDGKLAAAIAEGTPLVDHRLGLRGGDSAGKLRFAPRSITIVRV